VGGVATIRLNDQDGNKLDNFSICMRYKLKMVEDKLIYITDRTVC
jgi:hypothetical protein